MPESPRITFARRVREQRRTNGLTQTDLAQRLSEIMDVPVSATAITKIETGGRDVRLDEAVFLARALEVPLTFLVPEGEETTVKLANLRHEYEVQQNRATAAMAEHDQAQAAMLSIEHRIEELEAAESE